MAAHAAPVKTQLGLDELRGRARTLGQRHRTVLLLVDGRRPLSEVLGLALQAGAQTSHFEDLVRMGMVELPSNSVTPEARDSAPSAFDTLRVTSVELEVSSAPEAPGPVSENPSPDQPETESARSAPAAASAAAPVRAGTDPRQPNLAPARDADNPPSRAGALGPPVDSAPGARTVRETPPSLQDRQLPLAALVKPDVAPPARAPAAPTPPVAPGPASTQDRATPPAPEEGAPSRRMPLEATVPSRRMPLEASPAPPSRRMPLEPSPALPSRRMPLDPPPAPAPVQHKAAPAPALRGAAAPGDKPAGAGDQSAGRAREVSPANPRTVSGTPPAQAQSDRPAHSVPTAHGVPTLTGGSPSPAPRAPGRRTVLNRLASPRAGSLRVPDEPAATRLERVRELLVETLRLDAPLFGMRMLVRLRAATSVDDLIELVWDIERHLITARHSREEMLSLQRARELLGLGNTVVADDDG